MSTTLWMVRAGRGGELVDRYRDMGHVGIGQGGEGMALYGPIADEE
jgi:hypothetical protein